MNGDEDAVAGKSRFCRVGDHRRRRRRVPRPPVTDSRPVERTPELERAWDLLMEEVVKDSELRAEFCKLDPYWVTRLLDIALRSQR